MCIADIPRVLLALGIVVVVLQGLNGSERAVPVTRPWRYPRLGLLRLVGVFDENVDGMTHESAIPSGTLDPKKE